MWTKTQRVIADGFYLFISRLLAQYPFHHHIPLFLCSRTVDRDQDSAQNVLIDRSFSSGFLNRQNRKFNFSAVSPFARDIFPFIVFVIARAHLYGAPPMCVVTARHGLQPLYDRFPMFIPLQGSNVGFPILSQKGNECASA